MLVLSESQFEQVRRMAYREAGLELRPGKERLVAARVDKKIREAGLSSFSDYCRFVEGDRSGTAAAGLVDALTTNHTGFFREPAHFNLLAKRILPELKGRGQINIWSAACATGEEPWSIALCVSETLGAVGLAKTRVLASDISGRALETAQRAAYPADRLAGVEEARLRRFVLRGEGRWQDWYRVKKEIRDRVEFRRVNLAGNISSAGVFSVIFCRNVMIYFNRQTQESVANALAARLEPGGYLFIGHAETLNGLEHPLKYVAPATYRKAA